MIKEQQEGIETGMNSNPRTSFFGGTAYLGMPENREFKKLVFEGIERYGINHGASRNNNVTLDIFSIAEAQAATRCGAEASILLSSGYLAAQMVIQHYLSTHKLVYAPDTHPALWIGKPNPPKCTFSQWVDHAISIANKSETPILLISNSLNNLYPEIYNFDWLKRITPGKKVVLLVDDSHGIGITGPEGEGIYPFIPDLPNIEVIVIASMAKAIGVDAGVVLGKKSIIRDLRNSPVYAGSSPPSPGLLYAYVHAEKIYSSQLSMLRENLKFFLELISKKSGIRFEENFPVILLKESADADDLMKKGIIISAFPYPDAQGVNLKRIVINSSHTWDELKNLAAILNEENF